MYVKESDVWLTKKPSLLDKLLLKRLNASEDEVDRQKWILRPLIGLAWLISLIGLIAVAIMLDRVSTPLQVVAIVAACILGFGGAGLLLFSVETPIITPVTKWLFFRGKREDKDYIDVDKAPAFASLARVGGERGYGGGYYSRVTAAQLWCRQNIAYTDEINDFLNDALVLQICRQLHEAPSELSTEQRELIGLLKDRLDRRAQTVMEAIERSKMHAKAKRDAIGEVWVANARAIADVTETSDNATDKFTKNAV